MEVRCGAREYWQRRPLADRHSTRPGRRYGTLTRGAATHAPEVGFCGRLEYREEVVKGLEVLHVPAHEVTCMRYAQRQPLPTPSATARRGAHGQL